MVAGSRNILTEHLAGEIADVTASIELVRTGVADRITLTGMRFGQELTERLRPSAASRGVSLEASFWPDDSLADVLVSRADAAAATDAKADAGPQRTDRG